MKFKIIIKNTIRKCGKCLWLVFYMKNWENQQVVGFRENKQGLGGKWTKFVNSYIRMSIKCSDISCTYEAMYSRMDQVNL